MDITKLQQDFPLLQKSSNGEVPIYFDNACSTLKPLSVIQAMDEYYREYPACGGRSMHKLGEKVTRKCGEARQLVAKFIDAKRKEEIIFTRNTTEGINLIAHSLNLQNGDIVLTSDKEHNSNLIPWQILAKKVGIVHQIIPSRADNTFDLEKFTQLLNEKAKLVSIVHTSNLDGATNPVEDIIKLAHRVGAKVLLDSAQAAPHTKINVSQLDADFLVFSGHKMLGPSGTGVLYGKYNLLENLEPLMAGGETVEYSTYTEHKLLPPPEKFEAGLQNYAGIIGLGAALRYLDTLNLQKAAEHEQRLNSYITNELNKNPRIKIIGPSLPTERGSIVSFYVDGIDSHQIALALDSAANIMVRSGQHCVHSWFSAHKIQSSVRASLYFYNTMEEAEIFTHNLNKILKVM